MPTTSYPSALSSAAVTDESTPPDMATTTRVSCGLPSTSRLLSIVAAAAPRSLSNDLPCRTGQAAAADLSRHPVPTPSPAPCPERLLTIGTGGPGAMFASRPADVADERKGFPPHPDSVPRYFIQVI